MIMDLSEKNIELARSFRMKLAAGFTIESACELSGLSLDQGRDIVKQTSELAEFDGSLIRLTASDAMQTGLKVLKNLAETGGDGPETAKVQVAAAAALLVFAVNIRKQLTAGALGKKSMPIGPKDLFDLAGPTVYGDGKIISGPWRLKDPSAG